MDADYEIIERLIRNISHEIKNPLTTIKGYAQLLAMKNGDLEFIEKSRKMIVDNVDLIDNRINALYGSFELTRGIPVTTDVSAFLRTFLNSLPGDLAEKVSLQLAAGTLESDLDAGQVEKALGIIVNGYDWVNNPRSRVVISAEKSGEIGKVNVLLLFEGAGFTGYARNTFYLPFSDRKYFRRGTELFEVFCLSRKNGWEFDLAGEGDARGFLLVI